MNPFDLPRNGILTIRNAIRSLRRKGLDIVVLPLEGSFPERASRRMPLPFPLSMLPMFPSEVSLEEMQHAVDVIGDDQRVQGVVFRIQDVQAGGATRHTLRRMMLDLHEKGKQTVAWLPSAETWDYYLASACNEIILPPAGRVNVLGLRSEVLFLKDTLAMAGIEADLESIGEYKTTPDMFRRTSMTKPHREMLEAILDSVFDHFITAVAEQRGMPTDQVRELVDQMPMTPKAALRAGLIDATLYEDELAAHLGSQEMASTPPKPDAAEPPDAHAPLVTWNDAARWFKRPVRWTTRKRIGVISLQGMIVPGKSRRMPTPLPLPVEAQAGAESLAAALRQAEADPRIAAVIFHVDSPGGSSLASDLIWRQVKRLRERKPVVVLMGEQATSGGYYVCASANHIIARPTTITGSIGVFGGKPVIGELYDKLAVSHQMLQRGARADLYSEFRPFNDEEREQVREELRATYARFKQVVARGRGMKEEEVEEIARGRVWTGEQAATIGLVDELGDFETALTAAKELAKLEVEKDYTVVQVTPPRERVLPMAFPTNDQRDAVVLLRELKKLARERVWAMAPWVMRVRD
jgi:protease-4